MDCDLSAVPIRRRVLSTGPVDAEADTIVIDVKNRYFWRGEQFKELGATKFKLVSALVLRMPETVWLDEYVDFVWGDDENGGPTNLLKCIDVHLFRSKDVLKFLGVELVTLYNRGRAVRPINPADYSEPPIVDLSALTSKTKPVEHALGAANG